MRRGLTFKLLLFLLVLLPGLAVDVQAAGAPPGLTMEAQAALEGHFKYGEWLPVWVQLTNSGTDLDAEVQVKVVGTWGATTYAHAVSLPSGSRKRVEVYVLPNNFTRALEVQLVQGQDVLLSQKIQVQPHVNFDYLIGIVAPERGAVALLTGVELEANGRERDKTLIDLVLADLPERTEGLASLDCLILNNVDTSVLSVSQQSALEQWVRQGGYLVVGGGAGALQTAAGLPERLLPFLPRQHVEVDRLAQLGEWASADPVRVPGPFVVVTGESTEGETLLAEQDVILIRSRTVGVGAVSLITLDLAASPFDAWSGTVPFWSRLLAPYATYSSMLPTDISERQMRSGNMTYALSNLPSLALPSVQWLALLLGVYILLVGPVNYLLLRWRGRLQWAWVTIPLVTLLFAGGTFGLGYALRGTDLIINKVAVVVMQPDGMAHVSTYVGLFSPAQESYELEISGDGLLGPLDTEAQPFSSAGGGGVSGEAVFVQGNPARVRGLAVNQWSMQTFVMEGLWDDIGQIDARVHVEGDSLIGTVRNGTGLTIEDAVVVLGSRFARLGNLEPGQEAELSLRLDLAKEMNYASLGYRLYEEAFQQPGPNGPSREIQLKQIVLDNIFMAGTKFGTSPVGLGDDESAGLLFLGWFHDVPPDITIQDRELIQQTTALLYTSLSYQLDVEGDISLPPGLIPSRVIEMPVEGGPCGSSDMSGFYIGRGEAVFEFRLPDELVGMQVDKLSLMLASDGGWMGVPEIALQNEAGDEWAELADPVFGLNVVSDPNGLVADDGRVRVRVSPHNAQGGCLFLELGVTGSR